MFGIASGTGVFGQVGDALVDILCGSGIGPVSKWVDDHVFRNPRALWQSTLDVGHLLEIGSALREVVVMMAVDCGFVGQSFPMVVSR